MTEKEAIDLTNNTFALKQEPCEDAISRERALAPYKDLNDDDVISVRLIKKNITELPPVTPIGAKGHWISNNGYIWCSECNFRNTKRPNFCENCGAEMERDEIIDGLFVKDTVSLEQKIRDKQKEHPISKLKWSRIGSSYHSDNGRFTIKREPGTTDTWVLTESGINGCFIHWTLKGCKKEAERRFANDNHCQLTFDDDPKLEPLTE